MFISSLGFNWKDLNPLLRLPWSTAAPHIRGYVFFSKTLWKGRLDLSICMQAHDAIKNMKKLSQTPDLVLTSVSPQRSLPHHRSGLTAWWQQTQGPAPTASWGRPTDPDCCLFLAESGRILSAQTHLSLFPSRSWMPAWLKAPPARIWQPGCHFRHLSMFAKTKQMKLFNSAGSEIRASSLQGHVRLLYPAPRGLSDTLFLRKTCCIFTICKEVTGRRGQLS